MVKKVFLNMTNKPPQITTIRMYPRFKVMENTAELHKYFTNVYSTVNHLPLGLVRYRDHLEGKLF